MNAEWKIWSYLKGQGLTDAGAAGLMGNLYAESGLHPNNLQNSFEKKLGYTDASYTAAVDSGVYSSFEKDGAGYGLAQWTYYTRKSGLLAYALSTNRSVGDLEMQLEWLFAELELSFPEVLNTLRNAATVRAASDAVLLQFEKPADQSEAVQLKRSCYGLSYYGKYATKGEVKTLNLKESIMTKNPCYTVGRKITVKGLMLHSVGCPQPRAEVFIKNWNSPSYKNACVHAFIDGNTGIVYQTLPWDHRGWHCGSGKNGSGNNTHIGVEMCEPACIQYTGGSTFTCSDETEARAVAHRTYRAAVELFAMLCQKFSLNPLADGVIVSHKEGCKRGIASNHGDPEHLWSQLGLSYTMSGFRKDVEAAMEQAVGSATAAIDKLAKLKVIDSPAYWKTAVSSGKVKYLDTLLIKAAAKISKAGTRSSTPENGIGNLVTAGIINTPDYWLAHYHDYPSLGALLCALGGAVN